MDEGDALEKSVRSYSDLFVTGEGFGFPVPGEAGYIDDKTWTDLEMDLVFRKIDRTSSSLGKSHLYAMLRRPSFDTELIRKRGADLSSLEARDVEAIAGIMKKLGDQGGLDVFSYLSAPAAPRNPIGAKRAAYLALSVLATAGLFVGILVGSAGWVAFVLATLANFIIHYAEKRRVSIDSGPLFYLHKVLTAGKRLARLSDRLFPGETTELRALLPGLDKLRRRTGFFFPKIGSMGDISEVLLEYLNIAFLLEVNTYYFSVRECDAKRDQVKRLCAIVGYLDAAAGVAALRQSGCLRCCAPAVEPDRREILAEGLVHPLIENPVANSVSIHPPGFVLTGTNMSGKSTFLRAVAISQICALSIATAFADRFDSGPRTVISSIAKGDNISKGESLYLAEALRIRDLVAGAEACPERTLAVLDEVFTGTNSGERIAITTSMLAYLGRLGVMTLLATHDLEIASALTGIYDGQYFRDQATDAGLTFDYRIRKGIASERNAVRLLRYLGYPDGIMKALH